MAGETIATIGLTSCAIGLAVFGSAAIPTLGAQQDILLEAVKYAITGMGVMAEAMSIGGVVLGAHAVRRDRRERNEIIEEARRRGFQVTGRVFKHIAPSR